MRVVVALGGNALARRGEALTVDRQRANAARAAAAIAELAREHRVVVTHGNGPQVGLLALQAEAYGEVAPYPLDVLGAESEGMIGYLLAAKGDARSGVRDLAHPGGGGPQRPGLRKPHQTRGPRLRSGKSPASRERTGLVDRSRIERWVP